MNGDGTPDLLLGAPGHDGPHGANSGAAYVISGRARGEIDLGAAAGGGSGILFKIWGDDTAGRNGSAARAGYALAGAGDVNGDGKADLAISSTTVTISGGEGYNAVDVVYGKADAAAVDLDAPGAAAYRLRGILTVQALDKFGGTVAPVGDVNGDGRADLAVGAPSAAGPAGDNAGAVYLFYGLAQPRTIPTRGLVCEDGVLLSATTTGNGFGTGVALAGASFGGAGAPYLFGGGSGTVRGVPLTPVADGCGRSRPGADRARRRLGLRESFRRYVSNGFNPANPVAPIVATGGATCEVDTVKGGCDPRVRRLPSDSLPRRALRWTPIGAGATDGSDTTVATIGTVTFSYPGHFFQTARAGPVAGDRRRHRNAARPRRPRRRRRLRRRETGRRAAPVRQLPARRGAGEDRAEHRLENAARHAHRRGRRRARRLPARRRRARPGHDRDPALAGAARRGADGAGRASRPAQSRPAEGRPAESDGDRDDLRACRTRDRAQGDDRAARPRPRRTRSCAVSAPRSVRLKIAARKGVHTPRGPLARVTVPARVANGKRGEVRLVVSRAAARALAGRRATARVTVVVKADGRRLAKTLTVTLVGRSARVRR